MAKKKAEPSEARSPQGQPDEEGFKLSESAEPAGPAATGEPSKMDAVREALAEGMDSPEDGTNYVKAKYGFEMSRQMFSTYKANIKRREAMLSGHASGTRVPVGSADMFEILAGMKALVAEHGAERVKQMVDLVS